MAPTASGGASAFLWYSYRTKLGSAYQHRFGMPACLKELSSIDTTTTSDMRNYVSSRLTQARLESYSVSLYLMCAALIGLNLNRNSSRRIFLSVVVLGTRPACPSRSAVRNLCTLLRLSLCNPILSTAFDMRPSNPFWLATYRRPGLLGDSTFISYCTL